MTTPPFDGAERTLYRGKTHAKILARPAAIQVALLAAHVGLLIFPFGRTGVGVFDRWVDPALHAILIAAALWYVVWPFLQWHHSLFEVTDRRIRQRWGVLNKHSREIHLDRITQVNEERDIVDRIFRCGTIVIYDAANASAIRFHDVPEFHHVRSIIDDARHAAHQRTLAVPAAAPVGQEGW